MTEQVAARGSTLRATTSSVRARSAIAGRARSPTSVPDAGFRPPGGWRAPATCLPAIAGRLRTAPPIPDLSPASGCAATEPAMRRRSPPPAVAARPFGSPSSAARWPPPRPKRPSSPHAGSENGSRPAPRAGAPWIHPMRPQPSPGVPPDGPGTSPEAPPEPRTPNRTPDGRHECRQRKENESSARQEAVHRWQL